MRIVRNILAFAVALPIVLSMALVLLPDAELDPDAARWLRWEPKPPAGANVFEAMIGLEQAAGQAPGAAGARMVRAINAALPDAGGEAVALGPAWTDPPLRVDAAIGEICAPTPGPCLAAWRADAERIRALAAGHAVVLERYASLHAMPAYVNTLAADYRVPLPPVRAFLNAHRLWLAQLVLDLDPADPAPVVARLRADLALARRILAGAETILGKMVAASVYGSDLAVYAALAADTGRVEAFDDLAPLGQDAIDLGACVAGEFRLARSSIEMIAEQRVSLSGDAPGALDGLAPVVFKPDRATNLLYRHFAVQAVHAGLPAPEYARVQRQTGGATVEATWIDYVLDPVGTILFDIGRADLSAYYYRLHDLGGMVTLVNARLALLRAVVPVEEVSAFLQANAERYHGPYDGRALAFDAATGAISFDTPGPEQRFARLSL